MANNEKEKRRDYILENQVAMQAAVQTGGIIIAVVVFMLTLQEGSINTWGNQLVMALCGGTIVSLFAASTYYFKGSNPEESKAGAKELNIMGDVFFCTGLLCLFVVPPLLFAIRECYLATAITLLFLAVIWNSLFSSGIGSFGLKLIGLTVRNKINNWIKLGNSKSILDIQKQSYSSSKGNTLIRAVFVGSLFLGFLLALVLWLSSL